MSACKLCKQDCSLQKGNEFLCTACIKATASSTHGNITFLNKVNFSKEEIEWLKLRTKPGSYWKDRLKKHQKLNTL